MLAGVWPHALRLMLFHTVGASQTTVAAAAAMRAWRARSSSRCSARSAWR